MEDQQFVESFLNDFKAKLEIWGVIFLDKRNKNTQALLDLDILPKDREEILRYIQVEDYVEGPLADVIFNRQDLWVFGKELKGQEVYIKITMGSPSRPVICISFHKAEAPLRYHYKKNNK